MKDVRIKQTRMICSVKGCANRGTFFVTRGGDFAGTPNFCADCLKKASALAEAFFLSESGQSDAKSDGQDVQDAAPSETKEEKADGNAAAKEPETEAADGGGAPGEPEAPKKPVSRKKQASEK